MAAIASFIAGTVSVVGLMLLAPPLAEFALKFGPAECFALMVLGLTMLTRLAGKSLIKGLMMGMFGVIGYLMRKFEYPAAPVVLALVLGPMMETNFRRTLAISQGDYLVFLTHPISAFLLLCAVLSLAWPLIARLFSGGKGEVAMPLAEEI